MDGWVRFYNAALTLSLILISIASLMLTAQDQSIAPGSLQYWALVIPAVALPLMALEFIVHSALRSSAAWLLIFFVLSGAWHLAAGDLRAVVQMGLLVWVMTWASSQLCILTYAALKLIFYLTMLAGVAVYLGTTWNPWGILPGETLPSFGVWRVSIFPTVSSTGAFAFLFLLVFTKDRSVARQSVLPILICLYLLVFSYFRTGVIAFTVYVLIYYFLSRVRLTWVLMAVVPLLVTIAMVVGTYLAPYILVELQNYPAIGRMFLRGAIRLSVEDIYLQMYRPWLWAEHVRQFASSEFLMGLGSYDFATVANAVTGANEAGTESLPTRLLATYGWPTVLIGAFLVSRLIQHARAGDAWACACFAPLVYLMLNYGSVLHPTSAFFILTFMIFSRGRAAFPPSLLVLAREHQLGRAAA